MFCRGCRGACDRVYFRVSCTGIVPARGVYELDSDAVGLSGGWRPDYSASHTVAGESDETS